MLYFFFTFLDFYMPFFCLFVYSGFLSSMQRILYTIKYRYIYLTAEKAENDKSPTTLAFPWLKESIKER